MTKFSMCAALAAVVLCSVLVPLALSQQGNPTYPAQAGGGYQQYRPAPAPAVGQPMTQPAAQPTGQRMPAPVALLDVGHILEKSSRMKAAKDVLTTAGQQAEQALVKEQEAIRHLQEGLRELRSGTPDYKQKEEEIAKRISDLQVTVKLKRKQLGEQQSMALYTAYKEIEQEVQSLAAERGFIMVLRISRVDVPQDNLEAVYTYAGKNVVWSHPQFDITDEILNRLERRSGYNNPAMSARPNVGVPMPPRQ